MKKLQTGCTNTQDSSYEVAYVFDVAKQGVYYEKIKLTDYEDFRYQTALVKFGDGMHSLRRSHFVDAEDSLYEIENLLKKNALKGRKGQAVFVLGYHGDPFSDYDTKFPVASKVLDLFKRYKPGKLIIQTYSNFLVLAISRLLPLKDILTVNLVIETSDEKVARRFSPGHSTILERLKTASAMKTFGFDIEVQVAPLLPYHGGKHTAKGFAEALIKSSHRIFVASFARCANQQQKKKSPLAVHLAANEYGSWLRKGAAEELREIIQEISPKHLEMPEIYQKRNEQLDLFVA